MKIASKILPFDAKDLNSGSTSLRVRKKRYIALEGFNIKGNEEVPSLPRWFSAEWQGYCEGILHFRTTGGRIPACGGEDIRAAAPSVPGTLFCKARR